MAYKKSLWQYYARSVVIVGILMLPFLYLARFNMAREQAFQIVAAVTNTVFAPASIAFSMLCQGLAYCINRYYHGVGLILSLYVMSVLLYGYALALIWSWVSIPQQRRRRDRGNEGYGDYGPEEQ